jgi:hypothetical protein
MKNRSRLEFVRINPLGLRLGRAIVYDPAKRQVVGDPEATKLLRRPYRAPWKHPADELT